MGVLVGIVILVLPCVCVSGSLYEPTDPILQLDASNFHSTLLNSPQGHLVEFYLTWCGYCRNFAPTYKEFAVQIQEWSDVVKVAAMSCDDEANNVICAQNGALNVPIMKYYPKQSRSIRNAKAMNSYEEIPHLKRQLAQVVSVDFQRRIDLNPRATAPPRVVSAPLPAAALALPNTPNLTPLRAFQSTDDLWRGVPSHIKFYAVVFEHYNSVVGTKLVLDLQPSRDWVIVRRADPRHLLSQVLNIQQFPTVAVFDRSHPRAFVSTVNINTANQIRGLNPNPQPRPQLANIPQNKIAIVTTTTTLAPTTTPSVDVLRPRYFVSETDLLKAIRFALHDQLSTSDETPIAGQRFDALYAFLDIMEKYWPLTNRVKKMLAFKGLRSNIPLKRSHTMRVIFNDLKHFLSNDPDRSLSNREWKEEVRRLEEVYGYPFANDTEWVHCLGSAKKYRGYTCGLWGVFHAVTITAFLEQDGRSPEAVVTGIRNWIKHFVTCGGCTKDFLQMTKNDITISECVSEPADGITYLWKAHNRINAYLKGTKAEDPTFPKTQFPPNFICPTCGGPRNGKDSKNTGRRCDKDPGWNMEETLKFLIGYYTSIKEMD